MSETRGAGSGRRGTMSEIEVQCVGRRGKMSGTRGAGSE